MKIAAAGAGRDERLRGARHFIAEKSILRAPEIRPRRILRSPQIEAIELRRTRIAKERIFHFPLSIFRSEKKAERMLRIIAAPAESPANPQPAILLEATRLRMQRIIQNLE